MLRWRYECFTGESALVLIHTSLRKTPRSCPNTAFAVGEATRVTQFNPKLCRFIHLRTISFIITATHCRIIHSLALSREASNIVAFLSFGSLTSAANFSNHLLARLEGSTQQAISMSNSHNLPRERHVLASSHDFTVVAYDTERGERTDSNGIKVIEHVSTKAHDFAVSRDVLERIPYFRAILAPRGLRDTGKDFHELHEDDPGAWKIWLQILHDTVDADSYEVGIATVWNMLVIADKSELSPKREAAKGWFACWYKRWGDPETVDDCSEALYPCHTFDHPRGFARATKLLAYENEGHICEQMPLDGQIYHLRLDNRITRMSLSSTTFAYEAY